MGKKKAKRWAVQIPIAGVVYVEVEAKDEEAANERENIFVLDFDARRSA